MYMPLKDNLARIRKERRLSQARLAKLADVSQQLISRLESGVDVTTKKLPKIARALSVTVDALDENFARAEHAPGPEEPSSKLTKSDHVKINPSSRETSIAENSRKAKVTETSPGITPGSQLFGEEKDLPVFGTAQGGDGALVVTDQAVDWVVRPAPLLRVKDGYGMIVTGDSMDPVHKHGSIALVNPHLPWRAGDTCIFRSHQDDGTNLAIVKELRRYTDETWYVRQLNPPKDFTLKRSEWQVCHVTVGNFFSR